jgi:hypothetical protein
MPAPSWLLLIWSGCAATCAAALAGSLIGGRAAGSWALLPRPRPTGRALGSTFLAGVVLYPLVYGILFELNSRSHLADGVVAGAVHAMLLLIAARRLTLPGRTAVRIAVMHVVYGAIIALLYVTP